MAQVRGNAYSAAILLLITVAALQSCSLWHYASAATHTVGGATGWTVGFDYSTWAAGETFHAGDILFFPYTQTEHDVVVVDKAGYDACSAANAVATYIDGNTSVTLTGTGTHYYLCSVLGHCSSGMKLAVTVTATTAVPSASPPATAVAPSASPPASTPAPSPPPVTTPAIAPSPISPSPSAPAPAPSAETPAPVPSPSSPAPASAPTVGAPASSPTAPGSTPSSAGSPPAPSPPNAAPSLVASATLVPLALLAALFAL